MSNNGTHHYRWALWIGLAWLIAGRPDTQAAVVGQWLFDSTNTYTVVNSIPGGDEPWMQEPSPGIGVTNLHAAGGPFSNAVPYYSIGMMRTPTSGNFLARKLSSLSVDWTTKTQLTLEMWVNPYASGATTDPLNYGGQGLRLIPSGSDYYLRGYIWTGSAYLNTGVGSLLFSPGEWTHLALTYDGAALRTYVNGVLDANVASVSTLVNASGAGLYIGAFSSAANVFHGMIDEIRVSDVALLPGDGSGKGVLAWNATLVPEPSAAALLLCGAALVRCRRCRP